MIHSPSNLVAVKILRISKKNLLAWASYATLWQIWNFDLWRQRGGYSCARPWKCCTEQAKPHLGKNRNSLTMWATRFSLTSLYRPEDGMINGMMEDDEQDTSLPQKKSRRPEPIMQRISFLCARNCLWLSSQFLIIEIIWINGNHTCKKRVMLRRRLFWPKKICGKSA